MLKILTFNLRVFPRTIRCAESIYVARTCRRNCSQFNRSTRGILAGIVNE